ncbi:MAG: beta-galactosidase [Lachnospiraceae bacterium]|nr:beta-galactosidase [Lachnospiraceae bacterium]
MRQYETLKDRWLFTKKDIHKIPSSLPKDWEEITLPHTWNNIDGQDGGANYYRGKCWYVTELQLNIPTDDTLVYLEFQAANSSCEVFVNGKKVTEHEGGYSIFRVDITSYLKKEDNILCVSVDNEHQDQIYPQMADFTFYGGLYRDVRLIYVSKTHFDLDYYGSEGITASSKITGEKQARLSLCGYTSNPEKSDQILFTVYDASENEIAAVSKPAESATKAELLLSDLHLWQGTEDPYLYTIQAVILRHNEVQDFVCIRHGFREFLVNSQKGFFLNGKLTPLRGVSRHQDHLGLGNALTFREHLEDAKLIQELGANTIRLAHYQHSQEFYDLCDEMGFIVWAEIPFISQMNEDPRAHENCIHQLKELILQNYNHTSICFWGISNEITIGGTAPNLNENLKDLNHLAHILDDTRLTTMAQVSMLPMEDEQNQITDILSYNHYFGWYNGSYYDNEEWLDAFHKLHPNRALGISEYGCEGIISYHNDAPKAGDYSEEYQALYHEHMAKIIEERPWLWATHIWNMFDFGCDARDEGGVAGRNNKGLITFDRLVKKDSFYLYQAYWSKKPMIHICGKRYTKRADDTITVKIYSNLSDIELFVDGVSFEKKHSYRVFHFENVPLKNDFTTITAKSDCHSDSTCFEKVDSLYEPYIFVEDESTTGVTNWFETADLKKERKMTFRKGFYSVHDTMDDLLSDEAASDILINAMSSLMNMKIKKSMLQIMGRKKLIDMTSIAPSHKKDEMKTAIAFINEKLQEIPKEK